MLQEIESYFREYSDFTKEVQLGNKHLLEVTSVLSGIEHKVLHYSFQGSGIARKFLIVPSIFNSPEILFINSSKHLISYLREMGDVYLILWCEVKNGEYGIIDYQKELIFIMQKYFLDGDVDLIAHCISGVFALPVAEICSELLKSLTLLTVPWDFSHFRLAFNISEYFKLEHNIAALDQIPKIYIQILFFSLFYTDFSKKIQKYKDLGDSSEKNLFFEIENWLMSGHSLPRKAYLDITSKIFQEDVSCNYGISAPTYLVYCENDKLVPKSAILPLHCGIKNSILVELNGGHISYLTSDSISQFIKQYKLWLSEC